VTFAPALGEYRRLRITVNVRTTSTQETGSHRSSCEHWRRVFDPEADARTLGIEISEFVPWILRCETGSCDLQISRQ